MNREAFLKRVRQAAEAGRSYRVSVRDDVGDAGYVGAGESLCDHFAAEIRVNGGQAQVVDGWQAAGEAVASLLQHYAVQTALCWKHDVLDCLGIRELLETLGVMRNDFEGLSTMPADEQRRWMLAADMGISSVDFAVAETGSLVVCSQPGQERVASLLPPVHVAVVEARQIVPDLFDAFAKLAEQGYETLPSNLVFISGPSKTGDIELQLTTGVHGPGHWHVIVLKEEVGD